MRLIKYFIFVFLILIPLQAQADDGYKVWEMQALAEFSTAPIDGEEGGESTYAYRDDTELVRQLVETRYKEARAYTENHGNDPKLFWIMGELGKLKQVFHLIDTEKAGKYYDPNSPSAQVLIQEYESYYLKALELDDNPDAPDHLTGLMLSDIGTDVLGDPAIKARALEKAAALARAGNDATGNEMFEWNTYEARAGIYVDAKDYENALKIVNEMIARFPNTWRMDELLNWKQDMEAKVKQQKQQSTAPDATQDVYAQADTYVQPKAAAVQKPAKAIVTQKPVAPKVSHETANTSTSDENMLLWWLLGGGTLLALGGLYISRRKKG
jgi:LPXTG-motif cell wall-anchored protein